MSGKKYVPNWRNYVQSNRIRDGQTKETHTVLFYKRSPAFK